MDQTISQEQLGIIGRSPQIQEIMGTVRQLADTNITMLLTGESGVGKEVFARAIHRLSSRGNKQMISINCGAIPETLLESELFGHEKGAFTGAVESRKGLFEAANNSTIFLDEIGEMSLATQVKLLRVLETLEFTRVGSTEPRKTDVRVIAATNRDLNTAVRNREFRTDLFYRLYSAQIHIPTLRERKGDIPLLFEYFAYATAQRLGIQFGGITREALNILVTYSWPGNIRELKNFVELVITLERDAEITEEIVFRHLDTTRGLPQENPGAIVHLPGRTPEQAERELMYRALLDLKNEVASLKDMIRQRTEAPPEPYNERPALPPRPEEPERFFERIAETPLEDVERMMILAALRRFEGNRRQAAESLGVSERTLYRKLNQYAEEGSIPQNGHNDNGTD